MKKVKSVCVYCGTGSKVDEAYRTAAFTLGGLLARSLDGYDVLDAKSFRMRFKEPFGFVLEALSEPYHGGDTPPAAGTFACAVSNTVNGKRLDEPAATFPTTDAALAGGLERLRTVLGW